MKEIINLRNLAESNNNTMNIKDQFYLKIFDILKYFCNMMPNYANNIGKFPNFSLNDDNNIKYQNIINIIKMLTNFIISNNKNKNNINEENQNSNYNEDDNNEEDNKPSFFFISIIVTSYILFI